MSASGAYGMQQRKLARLFEETKIEGRWFHTTPGHWQGGVDFVVVHARKAGSAIQLLEVAEVADKRRSGNQRTYWAGRQTYIHEGLLRDCPTEACTLARKRKA